APVDPDPEGEVAVDLAVEDDVVGVVEDLEVAVGGRERQEQPVAGSHGATADVGVGDHFAGHGDGREHPEELFGGGVDEVGLGGEAVPVVGVGGEVQQ